MSERKVCVACGREGHLSKDCPMQPWNRAGNGLRTLARTSPITMAFAVVYTLAAIVLIIQVPGAI